MAARFLVRYCSIFIAPHFGCVWSCTVADAAITHIRTIYWTFLWCPFKLENKNIIKQLQLIPLCLLKEDSLAEVRAIHIPQETCRTVRASPPVLWYQVVWHIVWNAIDYDLNLHLSVVLGIHLLERVSFAFVLPSFPLVAEGLLPHGGFCIALRGWRGWRTVCWTPHLKHVLQQERYDERYQSGLQFRVSDIRHTSYLAVFAPKEPFSATLRY